MSGKTRVEEYEDLTGNRLEDTRRLVRRSFGIAGLPRIDYHYCIEDAGVVIAYCALRRRELELSSGPETVLILGLVTVAESKRKQGLGKELLAYAIERNRRRTVSGILANCGESVGRFYEASGFMKISDKAIYVRNGKPETDDDPVYYYPYANYMNDFDTRRPIFFGEDF